MEGAKHGKGVYYFSDGGKYDGEWEFDDKNGVGVFIHTNGDKY